MSFSDQDWQKALLNQRATLRQAIQNLNESGLQIVLVVSAEGVFQGTLTDGDIRRGLLKGLNLDDEIASIVKQHAFAVTAQIQREMVLHLMQINKIQQLPVVDEQRQVVGLYVWNQLTAPVLRSNPVVIMAGGLGTRLRPHTETCPKPLLSVGGKPMLEHILHRFIAEGFHHFLFAIHYLGYMIEDYFGSGDLWDVQIDYLRETSPLGTAGALSLMHPQPTQAMIVSNGDVLTDIRYGELLDYHVHHQAVATMAVRHHEWQHPYGVVQAKGVDIVGFEEKPIHRSYINAGIYALSPEALGHLKKRRSL